MLAKFGMLGALISAGVLFCACGGGDKKESALQNRVQNEFKSQLLSFEEANKEIGLKDRECLRKPDDTNKENYYDYRFIKNSNGDIQVILVSTNDNADTYSYVGRSNLELESLKSQKPECFN